MNQILVYTDLSAASADAMRFAQTVAEATHASLLVVRVVAEPLSSDWTSEMATAQLPEVQDAMDAEVRDWLGGILGDVAQAGVELDVETGDPAVEIARVAEARHPDLVVVGLGMPPHAEPGEDFAHEVLRRVACSVTVVRCVVS
jgi:nucleotide-binding universal stress UspA family protein